MNQRNEVDGVFQADASEPKSPLSEIGPRFIEDTMPQRAAYASAIEFARAMQRWALADVPHNNPQRLICINDWFLEELILTGAMHFNLQGANHG